MLIFRYEEALACYDEAIRLEPDGSHVYYSNRYVNLHCATCLESLHEVLRRSVASWHIALSCMSAVVYTRAACSGVVTGLSCVVSRRGRSSCLAALGRWAESAADAEKSIGLAEKAGVSTLSCG
jgi:tetratricopeptide (TPR) repeat protein